MLTKADARRWFPDVVYRWLRPGWPGGRRALRQERQSALRGAGPRLALATLMATLAGTTAALGAVFAALAGDRFPEFNILKPDGPQVLMKGLAGGDVAQHHGLRAVGAQRLSIPSAAIAAPAAARRRLSSHWPPPSWTYYRDRRAAARSSLKAS